MATRSGRPHTFVSADNGLGCSPRSNDDATAKLGVTAMLSFTGVTPARPSGDICRSFRKLLASARPNRPRVGIDNAMGIPPTAHFIWFGNRLPYAHALAPLTAARRGG